MPSAQRKNMRFGALNAFVALVTCAAAEEDGANQTESCGDGGFTTSACELANDNDQLSVGRPIGLRRPPTVTRLLRVSRQVRSGVRVARATRVVGVNPNAGVACGQT